MSSAKTKDPIRGYRVICGVVATMPLIYMLAALALRQFAVIPESGIGGFESQMVMPLSLTLTFAGISVSITSIFAKKALLRTLVSGPQDAGMRFKAALISMAISESGAVIGLVLILLTGDLLFGGLLCGLSFAVTCFHFPSRYWLEQGEPLV